MKEKLDKYLSDALYYFDLPGLSVSLRAGDFSWQGAAGYRDIETGEPLKTGEVFHMASVSKLFTATAVLQLVEKGEISLDSRLLEVLPWISVADDRVELIEIRHLLTHTSGLADVEDYHWERPQTGEDALGNWCRSSEVSDSRMLWSPLEGRFRYSNMAYEILGCLVAEVSGLSFEEYIRRNIFVPLGMENSTFLTFERNLEDMPRPHAKDEQKHIVKLAVYPYNREHGPSSTLTSCGSDMAVWARANLRREILRPETYDIIWKEYAEVPNNREKMGLGWFMRRQRGYQMMGHEGTDDGFRASFWICPGLDLFILVNSNLSGAPVKKINRQVFDLLME
ncbi:MAG: serine hydrolase domain-containing protein [Anaerovoracaceae bacterium]|jgi:CubicO group peptidase (beta-lactamase class C family)